MSQVCPSSSHQLVAAAIAFQRARRRFPKNYGLYGNFEDTTKFDKAESVAENEETHEPANASFASRKCSSSRPSRADTKAVWSDEYGESGSIKENLLEKPIICSCCRKRNEAAKANEPANASKTTDQCSAGDALDIVPSKEYNEISKKGDPSKSEQLDNSDVKMMKSFITESRNSSRCRTSYSHSRRRSPKETSAKLDSVNLLYDEGYDRVDNVKGTSSPEKRKCNMEEHCCGGASCRSDRRDSRLKLNLFGPCKDNAHSTIHRACNQHCAKHSNVDLSRPRRDFCRIQNRCCFGQNCCRHCNGEDCRSCSTKEKPRLASDTCLCSSNSIGQGRSCRSRVACESIRCRDFHSKDPEKISTVQEQNDEEYDDCVAKIDHKDSLCILVEKYKAKASKKCKHRKYGGENDFSDDRAKDDCDKSFASDASGQTDENANPRNRERYLNSDSHRFQENRPSTGKPCRAGCVPIFREGDCNQLKNLKSRLVKTGTCCSAKGTPWRHTF
ncbi:uncharacterized protein LOC143355639 [Halictus rubicundus]|uniref:uncharacterized protein LOC143355639 n=1 Tax=Halictus rubicundus TaxID=77578 RepID=UPI004035C470